jgi:hypothetical protein
MKMSALDFHTLRRAADVADAQRELVELARRQADKTKHRRNPGPDPVFVVTLVAIGVLSMLTLSSLG